MRRTKNTFEVRLSPELEELIAHFKPEFANEEHIRLVNDYAGLKKTVRLLGETRAREYQLKTLHEKVKGQFADMKHREQGIIARLKVFAEKRNALSTLSTELSPKI